MDGGAIAGSLILQVVLILVNAFFAATELAVITLNPNRLKRLVDEGDKKAVKLLRLTEEPSSFLSTIQIGITLAGFLGSAFAADNFAGPLAGWLYGDLKLTALSMETWNTVMVVLITLILSYFTLIFGELVPKRIAMQRPEQVARFAVGLVSGLETVMRPVIKFLSASTNGMLRLLRMKVDPEEEPVTQEDIRMLVDQGRARGTIADDERERIENVFDFQDCTAREVMTWRVDVTGIQADEEPQEVLDLIRESGHSRFPVFEEDLDDVLGTVSARDFLLNLREESPRSLRELIRPALFVPETVKAEVLFREMQEKRHPMAVVVDEYGGMAGIVTLRDIIEELVGDIDDAFDQTPEPELRKLGENLWRVAGEMDLQELLEKLGLEPEEEPDCETLSGLVFSQLSVIPPDGSEFTVRAAGLEIRVSELRDRRVKWAEVKCMEE